MKTFDKQMCTLLIAAAGKGTRLGYHAPKILYPVAGKPILNHILESFSGLCTHTVLVVSPQGKPVIQSALQEKEDISYAIQRIPRGMADAVLTGLEKCTTDLCACVWGDQPFFPRDFVIAALTMLRNNDQFSLVIPVCSRKSSYIHIAMDTESERVSEILQFREGDKIPEQGTTDCSMFFFRTREMREKLEESMNDGSLIGHKTKEYNFLPVFKKFDKVFLLNIPEKLYSSGINTQEQVASIEKML